MGLVRGHRPEVPATGTPGRSSAGSPSPSTEQGEPCWVGRGVRRARRLAAEVVRERAAAGPRPLLGRRHLCLGGHDLAAAAVGALKLLPDPVWDADDTLTVATGPGSRASVRRLACLLGIGHRVTVGPMPSRRDAARVLAVHDTVIAGPLRGRTRGLALAALAAGLPVFSPGLPRLPGLVPAEGIHFTQEASPSSLARALAASRPSPSGASRFRGGARLEF